MRQHARMAVVPFELPPPVEALRNARAVRVTGLQSPLGPMIAGADDHGLALLEFVDRRAIETQLRSVCRRLHAVLVPGPHRWIESIERELDEYFAGRRTRFQTPLHLKGTPFQESVWRALLEIPYGQTRSYSEQARAIGHPAAVRAVARAHGDNRLAIVVPCHRVIGANGRLTGYAGGLWRKRRLLEIERGATALGREDPRRDRGPAGRERLCSDHDSLPHRRPRPAP